MVVGMSRLIFLGSKKSGLTALGIAQNLLPGKIEKVITFDDSSDSRSVLNDFLCFGRQHNIPVECINPRHLADALKGFEGAKILVVGWYQILDSGLLANNDFIGLHYSPLPKYRGGAPVVWQMINGEKDIGVTFFRFSTGMDDGDYVGQASFPLLDGESIEQVLVKADMAASELLQTYLPAVVAGKAKFFVQNHSEATYCSMRIPEDGRIDWSSSAADIVNFIRAQSHPYPGAFSVNSSGDNVLMTKAAVDHRNISAPIGAIFERTKNFVVIKSGVGAVRIFSAELGSEKELLKIFKSLKERFV